MENIDDPVDAEAPCRVFIKELNSLSVHSIFTKLSKMCNASNLQMVDLRLKKASSRKGKYVGDKHEAGVFKLTGMFLGITLLY